MLLTIENRWLKLTVDTLGAQMMELSDCEGIQYLWDGDPKYWKKRAPNLFPFIGRLTDGTYTYGGQKYTMSNHGFAATQEFVPETHTDNLLTFRLDSNSETLEQYPCLFTFWVVYRLEGKTLHVSYRVRNNGGEVMYFAIGGHPGFRVPWSSEERFTDYVLEFSKACRPERIGFTPDVYISGKDEAYPLEDGRCLHLEHTLFDNDAIILKNMDKEVKLHSGISGRSITVRYPQMAYLGIWHMPKTDAPYVCIEPWSSLPSRQDVVEEITCKSDMLALMPEQTYENTWSITIESEELKNG